MLDASEVFSSTVAGLLSSSCCALQLVLNVLSTLDIIHIGCAGFNTVLGGEVRLVMRTMTFAWLGLVWYKGIQAMRNTKEEDKEKKRSSKLKRMVLHTCLTLSLMFLPELLKWSGTAPAIAPSSTSFSVQSFEISGMGCEACEAAVSRIIDRSSGVIASSVDALTGIANITISNNWNFDASSLRTALEAHGYGLLEPGQEYIPDLLS